MKVRIALAIDSTGQWNSMGYGNLNQPPVGDDELMDFALGMVNEGERRYWVDVDIDLPQPPIVETVTAKAEPA